MATLIGSLLVSLGLESGQFRSGLTDSEKAMRKSQKNIAAIGANVTKVGAVMSVGITAPFTALVTAAIPAAIESRQALAQVNAALASMGPAAGRTSVQLQDAAGRLQDLSNFDDDDILKKVTANLLTFGNVAGTAFDRAQLAAVNLSARMGTDLQASALMIGKALNAPVKGLAALSRAGIQFSTDQKAMITSMVAAGDVAGAQAIMLGELEKQFGGAAAAQRAATPGAESQQAWRTFQETVGELGLKALPAVTNAATGILNAFNSMSPELQSFTIGAVAVGAALGPVTIGIGGMISAGGALLPILVKLPAAFALLRTAIMVQALPAIASFIIASAPISLPIIAVAAAIAGVVYAIRNWDQIKVWIDKAVGWVGGFVTSVKAWLIDKLGPVWEAVTRPIRAVSQAFFKLYDAVVGHSYVPDMVDGIQTHFVRLDGVMVQPVMAATGKAGDAFKALADSVNGILDRLFPEQAAMRALEAQMVDLDKALAAKLIDRDVWAAARRRLEGEISGAIADAEAKTVGGGMATQDSPFVFTPVIDEIVIFGDEVSDRYEIIANDNEELARNFVETMRDIQGSVRGLADSIRSGDVLGVLEGVLDLIERFKSIGSGLGGGSPGGGIGGIGKLLGSIGGLFGGGSNFDASGIRADGLAALGGLFGGARALGGPVEAGQAYLVGERGRELFMPSQSGRIIPNGALDAANVRGGGRQYFDLRGAVVTADLLEDINGRIAEGSAAAVGAYDQQQRKLARHSK